MQAFYNEQKSEREKQERKKNSAEKNAVLYKHRVNCVLRITANYIGGKITTYWTLQHTHTHTQYLNDFYWISFAMFHFQG